MRRFSTVLLDAGGTLLDLDFAFLKRLLAARGCTTSIERIAEAEAWARRAIHERVRGGGRVGEAWRDYFRVVLTRVGVAPETNEEIIDTLWDAHQRVGLWTVPVPGAVHAVRSLKTRGLRVGVVSNAEGRVERDLRASGFDGLLDVVIDSFHVGVEKPDAAIFRLALERLGADASTAVHVGDVPSVDVDGAVAAGITAVLVDRHGIYPESPVATLRSISDLPAWLDGVVGRVD